VEARFGAFTFDGARREVRRGEQPVRLSPKAFDLLGILLRHRPKALSKAELHAALWPDTFVSDGSLAVLVAEIRRALQDSAHEPAYIRTVHRFGYAFSDPPAASPSKPSAGEGAPSSWFLTWGRRDRAQLPLGPHVIGRGPDADVCIDAVGVSRRHARLVVDAAGVTVEDLSSKNGTFVAGTRVVGSMRVTSAADIRLGALSTRIRPSGREASTQTVSGSHLLRGPS
jgi:DNA-binding winged helix-turn-helix (wHTH) protein